MLDSLKKNRFIMVCGLPGSGKTYLAKRMVEKYDNSVWISSDDIRRELYGSENEQGSASVVFEAMRTRTVAALTAGKTVIYDATNIDSSKRATFLTQIRRFDIVKECVICATPYKECVKRNNSRDRVVMRYVIEKMYKNWNTPAFFEGWDEIHIHYSEGARGSLGDVNSFVESLVDFPHDTPYHTETVGVHMKEAAEYIKNKFGYAVDSNMFIAALIHDCGKPYTKKFEDMKGNKIDFAHYYQHQGTGGYDALFFDYNGKTEEDILEISALICHHMRPFDWVKESTALKYKKQWGEEFFNKIMQLHVADENSSHKE